jgi:hypothetical protein
MTRRPHGLFLLGLLAIATLAPAALARVLSYSPYTNRAAVPAYQPRSATQFVLVEQPGTQFFAGQWMDQAEVVVYDTEGAAEPRVIFPGPQEPRGPISFAAFSPAREDNPPFMPPPVGRVLIQTTMNFEGKNPSGLPITLFGDIGGSAWKRIPQLDGAVTPMSEVEDFGGYFTRGLRSPVRIVQSPKYAFVLQTNTGIWGIDHVGGANLLVGTQPTFIPEILGGGAGGPLVLIRPGAGVIAVLNANTDSVTELGTVDLNSWVHQGWVTLDGHAYVQSFGGDGRSLKLYKEGTAPQLIGSGYPVPITTPPSFPEAMGFFAAPTHDYNGAWMIQRGLGKPTNLLRHTESKGIETFWSDVTGPQVEALHPGFSGERLLIQVHRPRVQPERWFIDPALAIWKIGDPAPRDYDELFLNETPSKGFIHLDVDKVAEGGRFVFDSGIAGAPDIIVSPPVSGGADVVQEWGVVRSSLKQQLVLPGVARLPGAFNSYWQSDVVVYNPTDAEQAVTVKFAPLGDRPEASQLASKVITLAPREIRVIKDVLKDLFQMEVGGGSLYIEPTAGVSATGRTYTSAAQGTYGFSMVAIDSLTAAGNRFPLSFAGAFPGPNFRTNIILTAPEGVRTGGRLQAYGVSGEIGASGVALTTPLSGVWQMNNLESVLSLSRHEQGGLVIRPTHGFAIPTVVAIDNFTNDPTYFPPDLPAPIVRTIPVIGHIDGVNNSKFRSDLYLLNLSPSAQTVILQAKAWDSNSGNVQISFTLLPNEARVIPDVLPRLFGMTGLARLRYMSQGSDGEGVRVTSRTYNLLEGGGTLGCLIPPLNSFQSASSGESLEILGVVGGDGFRANIGLVELSPNAVGLTTNVRIEVIDDKGVMIDSFQVALPSAGGMQINDLFRSRGVTAPTAALIRIKPNGPGLVGAYATLTDNFTNDTSFLAASLGATQ